MLHVNGKNKTIGLKKEGSTKENPELNPESEFIIPWTKEKLIHKNTHNI